ncbi:hypothetical protein [Cellulosimicrobium sp. Marseille-Q4280]|uniref:hypothetical protein n=1 Tax=Cellulosimicrobium sp. Marseille-Q4280 TaxID=2937992 RepID=UPI00203DBCF6|nr:hypothetical protein [Cellulosimicrobium sp. Marseille-Q4280]
MDANLHPVVRCLVKPHPRAEHWRQVVTPDAPVTSPGGGRVLAMADLDGEHAGADDRGRVETWRWEIFQHDPASHRYTARLASLIKGPTASGKAYSRWRTHERINLRVLGDGRWLTTARYHGGHVSRYVYDVAGDGEFSCSIRALGHIAPAPVAFADAYPVLATAGVRRHSYGTGPMPQGMLNAFAFTDDLPTITRRLFGVRTYRKDLARAVAALLDPAHPDLARLQTAWHLHPFVPVDWTVAHLTGRGPTIGRAADLGARGLRAHLAQLDQRSLRRLALTGREDVPWTSLADIAGWAPLPGLARVDSWADLHDRLMLQVRAEQQHRLAMRNTEWAAAAKTDYAITDDTLHRALEGTTPGGLTIELARNGSTLVAWSAQMRHCIENYQIAMWRQRSLLGAVRDTGGRLLGNFEVEARGPRGTSQELRQLLGKHNARLDDSIRLDVEAHLRAAGVHVPDDYAGSPRGRF